jgi:hypothetical protein
MDTKAKDTSNGSIDSFEEGPNRFLSNFYPARVEFEGLIYPSSEHAYQSAKTLDLRLREIFTLKDMTAAQSKRLGRAIKSRSDWETDKERVMLACLVSKFSDPQLQGLLLATGEQQLVEGNTWNDTYWGVCRGVGRNRLGELLMQVRAMYKNG